MGFVIFDFVADTGFRDGEGTIKAYVSVNLSLGDRTLAAQFREFPLDLRMVEAERVGCLYSLRDFLNKQNNLTYKCKSMAITSKGASFLEAPVSGSKQPAETGQLVILAAGDKVNLICASASVSYVWLLCW
ncbi:hypothetical protein Tsubulata_024413 [Turnera subulata]|uniref:6-phosphogluconate dehydrogenase NADP-binding domain-containing protein n=1 Tax=Turnera subulata TaxID=218843 RepID=A0A9Q0FHM1_9ROSI|nr:hypothetical protein Tsubulata_024413 [Turnera subulata]